MGGFTLIARIAPPRALARVFGVLESVVALSVGLGAVVTPVVMDAVGLQGALVVLVLVSPVAVALSWLRLRTLDDVMVRREDDELHVLRGVPLFDVLPLPALEDVARQLDHVVAGAAVFTQGEVGDSFYILLSGEAEVVGDDRRIAGLGPGDSFGQIALLHRVPRTATVRAVKDLRLEPLRCDPFLAGLRGTGRDAAAHARADEMLSRFAPRPRPEPS